MTVRTAPSFIQGNSHPAEETRLMVAGLLGSPLASFSGGVSASDPGHGVTGYGDLAVTQNGTPNMSVNVAVGGCLIRGTESAFQGVYEAVNDAPVNLAIATADATNPRRDLVILQVRDSNYSGAIKDARLTVVTGTPAASPSDPSLSSYPNALVLARVAVAAAASSVVTANITDTRTKAGGWARAWGEIPGGYVAKTATTTFTSLQDIAGLTITFTAPGNRKYEVSAECHLFSTVTSDIMQLVIADGTPTTLQVAQISSISSSFGTKAACSVDVTPAAGSVTYKVRAVRSSGTGTCTFDCGAVYPAFIRIEDIGPA